MQVLVQKYGGTSVGTLERIAAVAEHIKHSLEETQHKLVVVVSAMGTFTDELVEMGKALHPSPPKREFDMLLTAGERIPALLHDGEERNHEPIDEGGEDRLLVPEVEVERPAGDVGPALFTVAGGPVVPVLASIVALGILAGATNAQLTAGAAALVAGAVLYLIATRLKM